MTFILRRPPNIRANFDLNGQDNNTCKRWFLCVSPMTDDGRDKQDEKWHKTCNKTKNNVKDVKNDKDIWKNGTTRWKTM